MARKDKKEKEETFDVVEDTPTRHEEAFWRLESPEMAELGTIVVTHTIDTSQRQDTYHKETKETDSDNRFDWQLSRSQVMTPL